MDLRYLVLLFLPIPVIAITLNVEVAGTIDGYLDWVNITPDAVQKFSLVWKNSGSVGCESRARVDLYNNSDLIYSAWSSEKSLWPGDFAEWDLYSNLHSGNFTARIRVYHCNEIFESEYLIEVKECNPKTGVILITDAKTYEYEVEITIKSREDVENVVIIPEYPLGWIFESGKIDNLPANETRKIKIGYEPSIWKESVVEFNAITMDGRFSDKRTFILKKEDSKIILISTAILIIIILIYLRRVLSRKERLSKKRRKR